MNTHQFITRTFAALALTGIAAPASALSGHDDEVWNRHNNHAAKVKEMSFEQNLPWPVIHIKAGPNGYEGLDQSKPDKFSVPSNIYMTCNNKAFVDGYGAYMRAPIGPRLKTTKEIYKPLAGTHVKQKHTHTSFDTYGTGHVDRSDSYNFTFAPIPNLLVEDAVEECKQMLSKKTQQAGGTAQAQNQILSAGFTISPQQQQDLGVVELGATAHCSGSYDGKTYGFGYYERNIRKRVNYMIECGAYDGPINTQPTPNAATVTSTHLNRTGNMSTKGYCPFTMKFESTINVNKDGTPVKFGYLSFDPPATSDTFTKTSQNGMVKHVTQIVVGEKNKGSNIGNPKGKVYTGSLKLIVDSPSKKTADKSWSFECLPEGQDIGMNQPNPQPQPESQPEPKPEPKQVLLSLPDLVKATKIMIGGKKVNQNGVVELTKADSLGMDKGKCAFVANWVTGNEGTATAGSFKTLITEGAATLASKGHSSLKAGSHAQGSSRIYLGNGLHILNFETDKANQVAESDEGNNKQGVRLTVAGCDPTP